MAALIRLATADHSCGTLREPLSSPTSCTPPLVADPPFDWRAYLPALEGYPLLPCGAGADGKAPLNPDTGQLAHNWQHSSYTPHQIAVLNGKVLCCGTRTGPYANGLLVFDLDGPTAISYCIKHGCDPFATPTWHIVRDTDTTRLKVAFRVPPDLWSHLPGKRKYATGPREQIELFFGAGQVIVLGTHLSSGGHYYWPEGHTPADLIEPPPEWWHLALAISSDTAAPASGITLDDTTHPKLALGTADPVPLEQLLSREQEQLFRNGAGEGSRDDDAFRLAVGLLTAADGAAAAGVPITGDPARLVLDFAARCRPPFPEREALAKIASARRQPRQPDPNLRERLAFHLRSSTGHRPLTISAAATGANPSDPAEADNHIPDRRPPRSELLSAALDAAEAGDHDTQAELQAELMGRFRMTGSQVQAALFRLLTQRRSGGTVQQPGFVNVATVEHLDHLLPGFIAAREQTLLHAPKGTGKTLAALAIARSIVTGAPLLDHGTGCTPGRVLYLATDSGCASMFTQMQELGLLEMPEFTHGHPSQRFFLRGHDATQGISAWEATIDEILWLLRTIEQQQLDLVIIDSAKACLTLTDVDYTDNKAVGALLTLFQRVVAPRCAVLWLHHDGRETGHNAGAKVWGEAPVIVHRLERVQEAQEGRSKANGGQGARDDAKAPPEGARRWVCVKSRVPGDERSFHYTLSPSGELQVTADVDIVGNCRDAVIQALTKARQQGITDMSWSDLATQVLKLHGRSPKTVQNTISRMARGRAPELVRPRPGRYGLSPKLLDEQALIDVCSHREERARNTSHREGSDHFPTDSRCREVGKFGNSQWEAVGSGLGSPQKPVHDRDFCQSTPDSRTHPYGVSAKAPDLAHQAPAGSVDSLDDSSVRSPAERTEEPQAAPMFKPGDPVAVYMGDSEPRGIVIATPCPATQGRYRVRMDDGTELLKREEFLAPWAS